MFKKTAAGIAALAIVASMSGMTAFAADTEAKTEGYKEDQLNALVYAPDQTATIDCRYYADLPSVPYVKLSDYYALWAKEALEITDRKDGTYEVKVPTGATGIIDTNADTIKTDSRFTFFYPESALNTDENYFANNFISFADAEIESEGEDYPCEINLNTYHIDMIGDGGDIWCPVPTLCDLFVYDTNEAALINNTLVFGKDFMSDFSCAGIMSSEGYGDSLIETYGEGRPADLAAYNYNELCLSFDLTYGFPGRPVYTEMLREKGLDGMLSNANDCTKRIRELLLSTDYKEYNMGFDCLNMYLWDGGHTAFSAIPIVMNKEYLQEVVQIAPNLGLTFENATDLQGDQMSSAASEQAVKQAREALYASADYTEQLAASTYCEKGDVAVFTFDGFVIDGESWDAYYHKNGKMPEDVVSDFYKCVTRADQNPAIKRFVFDLGTNGGGLTTICQYMLGVASDLKSVKSANNIAGIVVESKYSVDKNLDKAFDEKDDAFKTDLQFGLITSKVSFSCGNWMPSLAKDNGLLLMGERSGGGACAVEVRYTADGMLYTLSSGTCLIDKDEKSIDLGIEPHYANAKVNEDGSKDFSETYNFANIDKCFDEFYGTAPVVTGTTESGTTQSETTQTTAKTETSASSDTVVSTSETAANSETTVTTTTAPQKYFAPFEDFGKMAVKDYQSKHSDASVSAVAKKNADGTVSIDILDVSGNAVDTYTVDPETGIGKDSKGGEVNLPQTGVTSVKTAAAAAAALALVLAGSAAVAGSGVLRKKDEEN